MIELNTIDAIERANKLSEDEVKAEWQRMQKSPKLAEIVECATGLCYDRTICNSMKVDYNTIPAEHWMKAQVVAFYMRE